MAKSITLTIGLDNVDTVCQAIQHGSGQPIRSADFHPLLERQVGCDDDALLFIGPADDFEEQFRTGLGERDVAQFIQDQQIEAAELFEEFFEA